MTTATTLSGVYTQARHGFTRFQAVRWTGSVFALAVIGDAGVGIVGTIRDTDTFEWIQLGELAGLRTLSLTVGAFYRLSTVPGTLVTTGDGDVLAQVLDSDRVRILPIGAGTGSTGSSTTTVVTAPTVITAADVVGFDAAVDALIDTATDGRYLRIDDGVVFDVDSKSLVLDIDFLFDELRQAVDIDP